MEKKITKRMMFTALLDEVAASGMNTEEISNEKFVEMLRHELELLDKKSSGERKPTLAQIDNENYKNDILEYMEADTDYTVDDLRKSVPSLMAIEASNQKVSALMNAMVKPEDGRVVKGKDGKKTVFRKA